MESKRIEKANSKEKRARKAILILNFTTETDTTDETNRESIQLEDVTINLRYVHLRKKSQSAGSEN